MIKVLLIDDEPAFLDVAKVFLEKEELSVTTALSADGGIKILQEQNPDAIICDYFMPGISGIALLKQLRANNDFTPFILFTGRSRGELIIKAINNDADGYYLKGGHLQERCKEIAQRIKKIIAHNKKKIQEEN